MKASYLGVVLLTILSALVGFDAAYAKGPGGKGGGHGGGQGGNQGAAAAKVHVDGQGNVHINGPQNARVVTPQFQQRTFSTNPGQLQQNFIGPNNAALRANAALNQGALNQGIVTGAPIARHSFYRGYWNNNLNNNLARSGLNNAAALGLGYGGYGLNNYYGGYGLGGYGLGGYGGYGGYGGGGVGTLLRVGLALAGYGGYGGLGGYGGYGGYGMGGYGLGGYGGYGLFGGYPLGWGLGGGLGNFAYSSGYLPYSNPYYASGMGGYNYAQPVPTMIAANQNPTAKQLFDNAVAQFKTGDYTTALTTVDNAIAQNPSDPVMHEFRALDLFALKNYKSAAATIHSVLAVGPGWNWATMSSLYADVDVYEAQLRSLEQATATNPNEADTHFLLAYHYMSTGHPDAASDQLAQVVRLAPNDRLAADLLKMNELSKTAQTTQPGGTQAANPIPAVPATPGAAPQPPQAPPQQTVPEPKPIDPAALVGNWHAERSDGSKFDLQIGTDKKFTWKFNQQGHEQDLTGTYDVEKDLLALESPQAGGMVGHVTQDSNNHFTFKLLGAPQDDQGLAFSR